MAGSPAASAAPAPGSIVASLPAGGSGGAVSPEYEAYVRRLRERVQRRLVYPRMAVRRGEQGTVELDVEVGPDGRLAGIVVVEGAGPAALAAAAVEAVRAAGPFPFPDGLPPRALVIRLPVVFRLR
jgi:TonB family protein